MRECRVKLAICRHGSCDPFRGRNDFAHDIPGVSLRSTPG